MQRACGKSHGGVEKLRKGSGMQQIQIRVRGILRPVTESGNGDYKPLFVGWKIRQVFYRLLSKSVVVCCGLDIWRILWVALGWRFNYWTLTPCLLLCQFGLYSSTMATLGTEDSGRKIKKCSVVEWFSKSHNGAWATTTALLQTLSRLFHLVSFVKGWPIFLVLNSKGLYQSSGKG